MIKTLLLTVCLFVFCLQVALPQPYNEQAKFAVRFGKHCKIHAPAPNVVRIFMDKDGNYYPDIYIRDRALIKNHNSLSEWYRNNINAFDILCKKYEIPQGTFEQKLDQLNDAIANNLVIEINTKSSGCDIVNVYVHGFSKKAYGCRLIDRHSTGDNKKLEISMSGKTNKKLFFVEVYWDSKFINVFFGAHKSKGYYIYRDYSISNALHVGLSLRKVISNIQTPQLNIITHSSGAIVACEILFNADTVNPYLQTVIPTPIQQHIKTCMIAPSMSAAIFDTYFSRAGNVIKPQNDNYLLSVVYNRNDFVLNKNLPFMFFKIMNHTAEDIIPTTLGCDYKNELQLLQKKVAPNTIRMFDLSYRHKKACRCHYLVNCYIKNKACFSEVVSYLEE
jgi:hypothetical protein